MAQTLVNAEHALCGELLERRHSAPFGTGSTRLTTEAPSGGEVIDDVHFVAGYCDGRDFLAGATTMQSELALGDFQAR